MHLVVSGVAALFAWTAAAWAAEPWRETPNNRGVVQLVTGSANGISLRIAEDMSNLIDDGATRRLLSVVGKGSLQNITDLKMLRGIDMAIVQIDALEQLRAANREGGITYIAKLYNEEFHLLVRRDLTDIGALAGQKVNVDQVGAGTALTAQRLFGLLKLNVSYTNDDQAVALEKLRKGEIAALAFVAGKPAPLFRDLKGKDGFRFLAVPLRPEVTGAYVPTRLTAADYPELVGADQPVETVAVGAVLAVANLRQDSERYRYVSNFVDALFTRFETLLEPGHHPKWQEVNLAADLPSWRRFPPAEQWLKRNAAVAGQMSPQDFKAVFSRFIDERRQLGGGGAMTEQQKDELFKQFQRWQSEQRR
jgi:TRAP-type uncharacterized transport system substrate-binding protein